MYTDVQIHSHKFINNIIGSDSHSIRFHRQAHKENPRRETPSTYWNGKRCKDCAILYSNLAISRMTQPFYAQLKFYYAIGRKQNVERIAHNTPPNHPLGGWK